MMDTKKILAIDIYMYTVYINVHDYTTCKHVPVLLVDRTLVERFAPLDRWCTATTRPSDSPSLLRAQGNKHSYRPTTRDWGYAG